MPLSVIKIFATERAVKEPVPLIDEPFIAALRSFLQTLVSTSLLAHIATEFLGQQCSHHFLPASHPVTEIGFFQKHLLS